MRLRACFPGKTSADLLTHAGNESHVLRDSCDFLFKEYVNLK
jgi:hypothetical protein